MGCTYICGVQQEQVGFNAIWNLGTDCVHSWSGKCDAATCFRCSSSEYSFCQLHVPGTVCHGSKGDRM